MKISDEARTCADEIAKYPYINLHLGSLTFVQETIQQTLDAQAAKYGDKDKQLTTSRAENLRLREALEAMPHRYDCIFHMEGGRWHAACDCPKQALSTPTTNEDKEKE